MWEDELKKARNIFSPGYEIEDPSHFIMEYLKHPILKKILNFTDQIVCLINNTNFQYVYISENAKHILGYAPEFFKLKDVSYFLGKIHPDDVSFLIETILPAYDRCMNNLNEREKMNVRLSYNYRLRKVDDMYLPILQHNFPLALENDKVSLSFSLISDISAYKTDDEVGFKMMLADDHQNQRLLTSGSSKEQADHKFTLREIDILAQIAEGISEHQIAKKFSLSIYTIKTHKKNMLKKTGMKNSLELVRYAVANQIV